MRVDNRYDTAVFLGPSLSLEAARAILPANYYPPISHGDLYQLRASHISRFVIIDGVFDSTTPVWHREILLLLAEGRSVVGASSMGALRAIELKPYGMTGFGVVYGWYEDGTIDGDDEVALLHADESFQFAALSQPLVNIRFNLQSAADAGVLSDAEYSRLLMATKQTYFGDRTLDALYQLMSVSAAQGLKSYFADHWTDLKSEDAKGVLAALAGGQLEESAGVDADWFQRQSWNSVERALPVSYGGCLVGGVIHPNSELLSVLGARRDDYEADYHAALEAFFLRQATAALGLESTGDLKAPADPLDAGRLSRNGLTAQDWQRHLETDARIAAGLREMARIAPELIAAVSGHSSDQQDLRQAAVIVAIGRWADEQGYCDPPVSASRTVELEAEAVRQACRWTLEQGPVRLGFKWDPVVAVFQRLQWQDRISELL